jgi:A/G-specific adenine glycosylase
MELGALVCTPTRPRCGECPVRASCAALERGEVERFPEMAPRATPRKRRDLALAFFESAKVLVGKRRDDEVWGGLWELPRVTLLAGESDDDAARRLGREVLGCAARLGKATAPVATTRHTVMNERIELVVLEGALRGKPEPRGHAELRWVRAGELGRLALPSPQRRVAKAVTERISERGK